MPTQKDFNNTEIRDGVAISNPAKVVYGVEQIAKTHGKTGLTMAAEKGKANITLLIIDVKRRDGTLKTEDLQQALKVASTKQIKDILTIEIAIAKAHNAAAKTGKPILCLLAEKDMANTTQIIIQQKQKDGTLKLSDIDAALEVAMKKGNKKVTEVLKKTKTNLEKQRIADIKLTMQKTKAPTPRDISSCNSREKGSIEM
jgi:hypothetical protein